MSGAGLANIVGFLGAAIILAGYAWQTLRAAAPDLPSTLANLIGATLLAVSLSIQVNIPSLCMEVTWALLALVGLVNLLRRRA